MPVFDVSKESSKKAEKGVQTKASKNVQRAPSAQKSSYSEQKESLSPRSAGNYNVQLNSVKPKSDALQMKGGVGTKDVHETAAKGVSGGGGSLPHLDAIQSSFGSYDVSGIKAHAGSGASSACSSLGAEAYTSGSDVAFKSTPDLHTAAHEAAHTIQQSAGVQLSGGVGKAGDQYERHADAVADRVVQGGSAEGLLNAFTGAKTSGKGGVQKKEVQFIGHALDKPLPESAATPEHSGGREATAQRQYSVEQYLEMWEKTHGRKMTDAEKRTIARGCIGITAVEINAVNPPLDNAYGTFDQAYAVVKEWNAFVETNKGKDDGRGGKIGDYKAVLFAKLFWSNQKPGSDLSKPDEKAFKPDPKTGKVDMSSYKYMAQPGYINFDYGFWDEDTQSFWHANHAQPGMKVYQSTKERFSRGYIDFDRIIFCVAWARNYKPREAAGNH
ncbi:MAG: DUF4157 domain-containing protein [Deltaproteobacteria bacterium]|nr:DUF4157 domain-containing protein [Deltaproteobacteria bacterium]